MSDVTYEEVLYEVDGPMAVITLNRQKQLNAWTDRMALEVKHAAERAENDTNVVAIVLTGAGRGFCAGADLKGLQAISAGNSDGSLGPKSDLEANPGDPEAPEGMRGPYSYFMSIKKPVIAAINGPCAGMAVPIALCCDLRFASDSALFTTAFVQRGLIAEWGISWTLPRLVGTANAMDMILSARKVKAEEAERIGLVNKVLPGEELMAFVKQYVQNLADFCSPSSMAVMKRQVYQDLDENLAYANKAAVAKMFESFDRPDFKEGVKAFLEKRAPKFPPV